MTFQGPVPEFWERYSRATNAPAIMDLGFDGVSALNERVVAAREFDALAPADQQLIVLAESQINAGLSPTLQDPNDWGGNWAAEDAEADRLAGVVSAVDAEGVDDAAAKAAEEAADPGAGWVGL